MLFLCSSKNHLFYGINILLSLYAAYLGSTHYTYKYAFSCRPRPYIGEKVHKSIIFLFFNYQYIDKQTECEK